MDYKTREDIPSEYKWDLSKLIKDEAEFNTLCTKLMDEVKVLESYKGKILKDSETLYQFLMQEEKVDRLFFKIYTYASMNNDVDSTDNNRQKIKLKAVDISEKLEEKLAFILPEILKVNFEDVVKLIENKKELALYQFYFERLYRYKKHTLSDIEEQLLSKLLPIFNTSKNIHYCLDNTDINLGKIEAENGKMVELTNSNYNKYMESKNRDVRISAFNNMYTYFKDLKTTFASNLRNQVKGNILLSGIKKFPSPLSSSLYEDNISIDLYKNLINTIHSNMDIMYNYLELKRKQLNLEEMHMYDIYVNLSSKENKNISFDECQKMLFESLKPLGDNYLIDLKKAFNQRWIDVYPNKGKKSGAYSWGCYDSYPYLLLNYNETINSVMTTAHELGHSMHSYYSNQQPYVYHNYPIFLAEIASTVNELLFTEYYLKITNDKEEKISLLTGLLDKIRATIYRQTMFAEFEMIIHDKEQKGISLTEKEISDTYYDLNKLYFGDKVISDENIKYEWARIPHFYTSFYVYKYATGLSCAISIVKRLLNNELGMKELYLEFLSSGCQDYPLNILNKMGIDLISGKDVLEALDYARLKLKQLTELTK